MAIIHKKNKFNIKIIVFLQNLILILMKIPTNHLLMILMTITVKTINNSMKNTIEKIINSYVDTLSLYSI